MNNFWQKLDKPILALAPMAGVTDMAFRQMCKNFGADVIYTEFASTDALVYKSKKTLEMIKFDNAERPVVVQIFGNQPEMFQQAGKILEQMGFDGIDINFGCPAYKVVRHGGGVSLMKEPKRCAELVQALTEAVHIPVSIKIRASIKKNSSAKKIPRTEDHGFIEGPLMKDSTDCGPSSDLDEVTAVDLVEHIKQFPVAALMLHARSFERPFDGTPNLEIVKKVRSKWDRILLYNGGVNTPEIARDMILQTGADGVGIARGAWGKPWLFQQTKEFLQSGTYTQFTEQAIKQTMLQHAEIAFAHKGEHGLVELRKHLSWYVKGWDNAKLLRDQLVRVNNLEKIKKILQ
jgi:tRNA-dihydrouridine synthase B